MNRPISKKQHDPGTCRGFFLFHGAHGRLQTLEPDGLMADARYVIGLADGLPFQIGNQADPAVPFKKTGQCDLQFETEEVCTQTVMPSRTKCQIWTLTKVL